jgi:fatty-acyl-CoA synthase
VSTIPGLVLRAAREHPDSDAFVFPDRRQTYAEVLASATEVAQALLGLGIGPGDAVGTLMPNGLEFAHAMIGTAMTGALFVPVNSRLAPREIAHVVPDSGMEVLLTTDAVDEHVDYVARLHEAFPSLAATGRAGALHTAVVMGKRAAQGFLTRDEFLAGGRGDALAAAEAVTPEQPYIMMYTSGTTAAPKGCPLTHASVVGLGRAVGQEAFGLTAADRMWNPLPMFHVSAQALMVGVLDAAAAWISMTHFEVDAALEQIERERATILYPAYPTLTSPLLKHPSYGPDTFRRARALLTVGPPDLLRSFQDLLPHTVHVSCYGSTETGGVAIMGRLDDPLSARLTSGKPFSGVEAQVRDPVSGEPLPADETGPLWIRGFNLFQGYHGDPEATAAAFDDQGWFHTGDLASIDAGGNLTFRGRTKDMLKVGGESVGCLEVEAHLGAHPDVQLAAVVGVPDPKYGEVPAAFVELRPGAVLSEEEVLEHCRAGLAKYKVPRHVRFTSDWPMSTTKIQKFRLRDRLLAELGERGEPGG